MHNNLLEVRGFIHSIESFGAVDGPGVRFVVFFQGCPLRCLYCHNPDTWKPGIGKDISVGELIEQIKKYKSFISSGGVTFSGGEPMLQPEFLEALLLACKEEGFHTAIDTSGALPLEKQKAAINASDLLLLDLKCIDTAVAKRLTGIGNENMFSTLDYCQQIKKPVWIRQVLLDGFTLDRKQAHLVGEKLKDYSCIEKIELLPFHQMASYKWEELGLEYTLKDLDTPDKKKTEEYKEILRTYGLIV